MPVSVPVMKKRSGMYSAGGGEGARQGFARGVHGANESADIVVCDAAGERETQTGGAGGNRGRADGPHGEAAALQLGGEMDRGFIAAQDNGNDVRGTGSGVES